MEMSPCVCDHYHQGRRRLRLTLSPQIIGIGQARGRQPMTQVVFN